VLWKFAKSFLYTVFPRIKFRSLKQLIRYFPLFFLLIGSIILIPEIQVICDTIYEKNYTKMRAIFIILILASSQRLFAQQVLAAINVVKPIYTSIAPVAGPPVTDIDGNNYKTVKIGTQIWMAENLKTTRYSDGTAIPLVNNPPAWSDLTSSGKAYCWYNDDITNKELYGALYTWAAAMNGEAGNNLIPSGVQGVCPTGWHMPSDAEWKILTDFLTYNGFDSGRGIDVAKSIAARSGWKEYHITGTVGNDQLKNNESGFSALPGGSRLYNGTFNQAGNTANWWRATEFSESLAYYRYISYCNNRIYQSSNNKQNGFSVRCLRD